MAKVNEKEIYEVKGWLNDTPQNKDGLSKLVEGGGSGDVATLTIEVDGQAGTATCDATRTELTSLISADKLNVEVKSGGVVTDIYNFNAILPVYSPGGGLSSISATFVTCAINAEDITILPSEFRVSLVDTILPGTHRGELNSGSAIFFSEESFSLDMLPALEIDFPNF